jgi:predicted signal transduction protein with EAL and GGDEF domain
LAALLTIADEFAILCDEISNRPEAIARGHEIQAIFAAPCAVEGRNIALTGACGFALFLSSTAEPEGLARFAVAALWRGRPRRGGRKQRPRSPRPRGRLAPSGRRNEDRRRFSTDRRLENRPDQRLRTLARFDDAALGPIAPSVFTPIAEEIGVMEELSRDLLRKAARTAAEWPADVSLSFNLTAAQNWSR